MLRSPDGSREFRLRLGIVRAESRHGKTEGEDGAALERRKAAVKLGPPFVVMQQKNHKLCADNVLRKSVINWADFVCVHEAVCDIGRT
jgi:hypothetical protein